MIDLHMHFDGSLLPGTIARLARQEGIPVPEEGSEEFARLIRVPDDCEDLNRYLACFDLPLSLLQRPDAVRQAMEDLVWSLLAEEHLLYAELRFAPSSLTRKGASQEEIVLAALEGLRQAQNRFQSSFRNSGAFPPARKKEDGTPGRNAAGKPEPSGQPGNGGICPEGSWIPCCQLILCCMRGTSTEEENLETVRLADRYRAKGVAAVDLAGPEAGFPTHDYRKLFQEAEALGLPFTVHAGEAAGPANIREAVGYGAARIGHGIAAAQDPPLVRMLAERQIPLECCPVSNVQTRAVARMADHPVRKFLNSGLKVTVNTDNRTVSGTDLKREYRELEENLGLTQEEKFRLLANAADAAFLPADRKASLKSALNQKTASL